MRHGNKIEARIFATLATVRSFFNPALRVVSSLCSKLSGGCPRYLPILKQHFQVSLSVIQILIGSTMALAGPLLRVYCTRITFDMPHGTVI